MKWMLGVYHLGLLAFLDFKGDIKRHNILEKFSL